MPYHDVETADSDDLRALQDTRLTNTVQRAYENVPFYRDRLDDAGVSPDTIEGVEDLQELPFTTKEHFREEYPTGLFAVDMDDVLRIHASSGTTGKPKVVGYTETDLGVWESVMARSLYAAGVSPGDTVQNAYGYGLFTGGLGFHDGVEALPATVIPTGGGNTERQISMLQDLESDAFASTPSYCLYLAERAAENGVDVRDLPLSTVTIGAEPFTDPMREEIEAALGVDAIDVYGLSEIIGPGVAIECEHAQDGLHVWEDHFYPEVIDPQTGEVLPPGEEGELVLTTLTKEALPVLRYRTGDVTSLTREECDCGRTMVRMDNVTGRTDDLLVVRGVNLYPSQIEAAVLDFEDVAPQYRIDVHREGNLDRLELTIEHHEEFSGSTDALADDVQDRLADVLALRPDEVDVVAPGGIERQETGKIRRVWDHRE
ncbi:phenylacetate--CoA ligase PaaK [Halobacterium zhouii]|uniref:phenylacetate--CoA ligase PaaK n=1 Tax=Halobacterium zhouii TaxID=2902624 RepID=UPI001E5794A2|nr:phenylacetate--CoA ligase PaaK [Halobacterium zhouii]